MFATKSSLTFQLILVAWLGLPSIGCGQSVSTSTMESAKKSVLDRVGSLGSDSRWIVGQNIGHSENFADGYRDNVARLHLKTGQNPGMLGLDLGYETLPTLPYGGVTKLQSFARQGGLVTISMHPPNPWGENSRSGNRGNRDNRWDELFVVGSPANQKFERTLRAAADCLQQLRDKNVVVLWRPFHEMNGGWFWWCQRDDQDQWTRREQFRQLWRRMHQYMVIQRGLDNLIWVYSAAVQTDSGQRAADDYYPGDDVVDVVGLDWYSDGLGDLDSFRSYWQLLRFNKPIAITEFGPKENRDGSFDNRKLIAAVAALPRLSYVMYWHSWPGAKVAIVDQQNARELMVAPETLGLDDLKTP